MWLLDTSTLKLRQFDPWAGGDKTRDRTKPPYAILSHTWADEEVLFHDIDKSAAKDLRGYEKIKRSCALAHSQGFQYIWIDTCCIDKSSSAELSEAINSMYDWYRCSAICYVYLSDFNYHDRDIGEEFARSRWFTRGWCLQELLAPYDLEFYDKDWHYMGDKIDLAARISSAARISQQYILDWDRIRRASVATRMSWASRRSTTRLEDEAYCLMGLFEVNMPLLYGEGRKAFLRLQHEIARNSDDESLFAWHSVGSANTESGIFAHRPYQFEYSQDFEPYRMSGLDRAPNSITSRGLAMEAYYAPIPPSLRDPLWGRLMPDEEERVRYALLPLHCASTDAPGRPFFVILKRLSRDTYVRFLPSKLLYLTEDCWGRGGRDGPESEQDFQHRMIYVREPPPKQAIQSNVPSSRFLNSARIVPHSSNTGRYALKHWYLARDSGASVKASFYNWEISFINSVVSKPFAVLMFKRVGGSSIIVVLTLHLDARTKFQVTLRVALQSAEWTKICKAAGKVSWQLWHDIDPDEVDVCWQACGFSKYFGGDLSVQAHDGTVIRLERPELSNREFVLALEQPPIHSDELSRHSAKVYHGQ